MKDSILRRFPDLGPDDVRLRDDGDGVYIEKWPAGRQKPTMATVNAWVAEDENIEQPKTEIEILKEENEGLQAQLTSVLDALDFILMGGE